MQRTTMVYLDPPPVPKSALVCPVCGKLHSAKWWAVLFGICVLALMAAPVFAKAKESTRFAKPSTAGLKAFTQQSHTYREPLIPPLTPAAAAATPDLHSAVTVPDTAVVWNRAASGIFTWDRPDGEIAGYLENGTLVHLTENWLGYGGAAFGEISIEGSEVWVDMRSVHRVALPEGGFQKIGSEQGEYLYTEPAGRILDWLPPGTPVLTLGTGDGGWVQIQVLVGGEQGWIRPD